MGRFRVSRDACHGVEGMFLCRPRAGLRSLLPRTPGDCGLILYQLIAVTRLACCDYMSPLL